MYIVSSGALQPYFGVTFHCNQCCDGNIIIIIIIIIIITIFIIKAVLQVSSSSAVVLFIIPQIISPKVRTKVTSNHFLDTVKIQHRILFAPL